MTHLTTIVFLCQKINLQMAEFLAETCCEDMKIKYTVTLKCFGWLFILIVNLINVRITEYIKKSKTAFTCHRRSHNVLL
jgi:hypothetical protein